MDQLAADRAAAEESQSQGETPDGRSCHPGSLPDGHTALSHDQSMTHERDTAREQGLSSRIAQLKDTQDCSMGQAGLTGGQKRPAGLSGQLQQHPSAEAASPAASPSDQACQLHPALGMLHGVDIARHDGQEPGQAPNAPDDSSPAEPAQIRGMHLGCMEDAGLPVPTVSQFTSQKDVAALETAGDDLPSCERETLSVAAAGAASAAQKPPPLATQGGHAPQSTGRLFDHLQSLEACTYLRQRQQNLAKGVALSLMPSPSSI